MPVKFTIGKSALILSLTESLYTLTMFFIILELSFISILISLINEDASPMFLIVLELTTISILVDKIS